MTETEANTNLATIEHIETVRHFMRAFRHDLERREVDHDQSKLDTPEREIFAEYTPKLAASTYGSEEYEAFRAAMKPALDHHYAKNTHHPEHYKDGVNDMTLLDLVEMFCDWKAATMRHNDGNLRKSIEINAKRFGIDSQLVRIMENTVEFMERNQP